MKPTLVFVYNADSGLFNGLADIAHKIFSPQTYQCNLCAITHSTFGMRDQWKTFINNLEAPVEFLHADEWRKRYRVHDVPLPAIFTKSGEDLRVWITAAEINACRAPQELEKLIEERLENSE
ncbi:MAG: hypothetical protein WKF84_17380 [Pyrinomonadaceae bacterium]